MFVLVVIAVIVGALGGLAISRVRTARVRRRALIGWCCLPVAVALVVVVYIGLISGAAFATWPLPWVGLLVSVPVLLFALGGVLGFQCGLRLQPRRID